MITLSERLAFVKKAFGEYTHDREYRNVSVVCPACRETKGTVKKKLAILMPHGIFHCWSCGLKGRSLRQLVKKYSGGALAKECDVVFKNERVYRVCVDSDDGIEDEEIRLPDGFRLLAMSALPYDDATRAARDYVEFRGATESDMWRFGFGVCDDPVYAGTVVVPSFDSAGALNYFCARAIASRSRNRRYINCGARRSDIVFNEMRLDWRSQLVIVEGLFDLLRCPPNSTALLGSELNQSSRLFRMIVSARTPVILFLDDDAKKKASKIARTLYSCDVDVKIAAALPGVDPGSMTKAKVEAAITSAKRWDPEFALVEAIGGI